MTPAQEELIRQIWLESDRAKVDRSIPERYQNSLRLIHEYNKRWLADHADTLRSLIDGNTEDPLGATLQPIVESMEHLIGVEIPEQILARGES